MKRTGAHHVGLASRDYESTVDFYTNVMGWEIAWNDLHAAEDGTPLVRHIFFNTGDGSLVAFMCYEPGNPAVPAWTTDINSGLGLGDAGFGVYHFAFWADNLEELAARQGELRSRGCEVSEVFNHGWCSSIYLRDPNGILLEYCVTTRAFTEDDKLSKERYQPGPPDGYTAETMARDERLMGMRPGALAARQETRERELSGAED